MVLAQSKYDNSMNDRIISEDCDAKYEMFGFEMSLKLSMKYQCGVLLYTYYWLLTIILMAF